MIKRTDRILIAMVAVVMMVGQASAAVIVDADPTVNFTTGTYNASAAFSAVTFGIHQDAAETLANVTVNVTSEGGPAVSGDFASLTVYKEDGTTAGFQSGEDTEAGIQAPVNVDSNTTIDTTGTGIGVAETTFYVVVTLAADPGDTHQFSVDMAADGVVTNASSLTVTALDGSVTAIATIDTTAPTLSSAARNSDTQITVTMSESVNNLGGSDGGFTVAETGAPGTTYAVSAIAAGGSADLVVLTVADMNASIAAGVTVNYTAGGDGSITDTAGNALATDAVGVAVAAWDASSTSGNGEGTYPPGWFETPTPTLTVTPTVTHTPAATPRATPTAPRTEVRATPARTAVTRTTPAAERATPEPRKGIPGFEGVFTIAGLLAVAYLVLRQRRE